VKTLEQQSNAMDERVGSFKLAGGQDASEHRQRAAVPIERPAPAAKARPPVSAVKQKTAAKPNGRGAVGRMQTAVATAFKEEADWKEF
jgi:hypothetical protein